MIKLLNAGFFRLKRNKMLWIIVVITLGIASFQLFNHISSVEIWGKEGIDKILINYITMIGIFIAIFTSLFIGAEYANGAIRNKLVVGNSRIKIYLSNLILSIVAGCFIEFIYMVFVSIIGIPTLGGLQMSLSEFAIILLNIIMIIITYSSIFTLITLLCSDITMSTVISIVLIIAMFVGNMSLSFTADSTEFRRNTIINEQGKIEEVLVPDPNYPGDSKKKIAQTILYIMPTGQADKIAFDKDEIDIKILLLYSLGVSVIVNVIGIYCFSKKDLK